MWHTARGLAHAAQGTLDEAETERAAVGKLQGRSVAQDARRLERQFRVVDRRASATKCSRARSKRGSRRADQAVRHFAQAVAIEDGLTYMEPPDWPVPVRQLQGAALLELGRAKEAETAFRDDMKKFPDNGWSLSGLQASLVKQGRTADAAAVKARFEEQWKMADVQVAAGRPRDAKKAMPRPTTH